MRRHDLQKQLRQQGVLQQGPDAQTHDARIAPGDQGGVAGEVSGRRHHPLGAFGDHLAHRREFRTGRRCA
jgi:hypothetical protein